VPSEPGKQSKKQPSKRRLPEREDALKIDLPFEDAVKTALDTPAPPLKAKAAKKLRKR
jgi:hypothetical protein